MDREACRRSEKDHELWIQPASLQKGTTPTVRNPGIEFLNYRHPVAKRDNFGGEAAIMNDRYKLIVSSKGKPTLYDILSDLGETKDLAAQNPAVVRTLSKQLRAWQSSVETSLTGADY